MRWRRRRSTSASEELLVELRQSQHREPDVEFEPKRARRANLSGTDLAGADLRWADLTEADLRRTDLRGARLDGADLTWARLSGADLRDVQFGKARLVEADLSGADVTGADFSEVTGLTWAAVRKVVGVNDARWPQGFDPSRPRVGGPVLH